MMKVKIKNLAEIRNYLEKLPKKTFDDAWVIFSAAAFRADAKIKYNATTKLKVRTGALRRSIVTEVSGEDLGSLRASVGSAQAVLGRPVVYAPLHEYGGTVRAKNAYRKVPGGPYLNIPTSTNKTPAGVTRLQAREVFNQGGRVGKTKKGSYGVFLNGQMMFTLKKQVVIPARLGMIKAAEDEVPTILSGLVNLIGED